MAPTLLFHSMLTSVVVVASEVVTSTAFQEHLDQAEVHGQPAIHLYVARMLTAVLSWLIPNTTAQTNSSTAKQPSSQFAPSKNIVVVTKLTSLATLAHNRILPSQFQKAKPALSKLKHAEESLHLNQTTRMALISLFWITTMMILLPKTQESFKPYLNQVPPKIAKINNGETTPKINHVTEMMTTNLAMFHKKLNQWKLTEMTPKIMMKMAQMASALEHEEKKVNQSLALRKVSMTPLLKTILTINSRVVSTMAQRTVSISQDISKSL